MVHFRLKKPVAEANEDNEEVEHQYPLELEREITHALSTAEIAKARNAAGRADIYALWAEFRQYNMTRQNELENVAAAFIGWCGKHKA